MGSLSKPKPKKKKGTPKTSAGTKTKAQEFEAQAKGETYQEVEKLCDWIDVASKRHLCERSLSQSPNTSEHQDQPCRCQVSEEQLSIQIGTSYLPPPSHRAPGSCRS